jgi:hypothetical protein
MNAEALRAMDLEELILEIHRQVSLAVLVVTNGDLKRVGDPDAASNLMPLMEIGDFEIWPRWAVVRHQPMLTN